MTQPLAEYAAANVPVPKAEHPQGWEPSVVWNGKDGVLCTGPVDSEPDPAVWAELIKDWGLDPSVTEIVDGSVQVRAWDANVGKGVIKRLKYYRASIRSRQSAQDRADIEELIKQIGKRKPIKGKDLATGKQLSVVVPLSDWQLGKGEGGGTPAAVERIERGFHELVVYINGLIKLGRTPQAIYLVGLGDLVENCSGHYMMQAFQADLDVRSQKRLARRLVLMGLDMLLPYAIPIIFGAVPGNHGERRNDGKAYTTLTDNMDLEVIEEIGEIIAVNPDRYGKVYIPSGAIADDLTMTLSISGVCVGFAHGHQMRSGPGGAQGKIEKWWHGQALGRQRVADAQILFSGHLHHLVISEATGRTMIQVPAMDGGSQWWTGTTGQSSPAGMVAVGVGTYYGPRGWGDLALLGQN